MFGGINFDDLVKIRQLAKLKSPQKFLAIRYIHTGVTSFKMHNQWLLYPQDGGLDCLGSFLSGCLM